MPGAAKSILNALSCCGLESDEAVQYQSERGDHYKRAFEQLLALRCVFPCSCSRKDVALASVPAQRGHAKQPGIYPGTCRAGLAPGLSARAWRFRVDDKSIEFTDRAVGLVRQDLGREVGDFIVRRADGPWAYQLAVVVDDGRQGITHVVRGADLIDNTPRQIALQRALEIPRPHYLHVPVVKNQQGEKLSKQTGAPVLDTARPLAELERAGTHLGLPALGVASIDGFLSAATDAWAERFGGLG
jgi:glutamyl-Q tRNA(Asp) synthetase